MLSEAASLRVSIHELHEVTARGDPLHGLLHGYVQVTFVQITRSAILGVRRVDVTQSARIHRKIHETQIRGETER